MHARDYNPAADSFVSVDPLQAVTGQPYIYAGASPVNLTDPAGLCIVDFGLLCGVEDWLDQRASSALPSYVGGCLGGSAVVAIEFCGYVTQDGSVYVAPGVGFASPGPIFSLGYGKVIGSDSNCQIDSFVNGSSFTLGGISPDFYGASGVWGQPGDFGWGDFGVELTAGAPGWSVIYTHATYIGNLSTSW
jgi:hypothetical protein